MAKPVVRTFAGGPMWVVKVRLRDGKWLNYNTRIGVEFQDTGEPTAASLRKAQLAQRRLQDAENRGLEPFRKRTTAPALREWGDRYLEQRVAGSNPVAPTL